jgi:uncharacterized protein
VTRSPGRRGDSDPPAATLLVRVVPRAGRSTVAGVRGDALLVRLAAAPVDGEANAALIDLLARQLDLPRRAISLVSGARGREKRVRIAGLDAADLQRRLSSLLDRPQT